MRHYGIIAKMREQGIESFAPAELDRVFRNCVSPISCKRYVAWMIQNGLTIEEVRAKFPIAQNSLQTGLIFGT